MYAGSIRDLARQNVEVQLEAYDLGRTPLSELLAEQRRYLDVEAAYTSGARAGLRRRGHAPPRARGNSMSHFQTSGADPWGPRKALVAFAIALVAVGAVGCSQNRDSGSGTRDSKNTDVNAPASMPEHGTANLESRIPNPESRRS